MSLNDNFSIMKFRPIIVKNLLHIETISIEFYTLFWITQFNYLNIFSILNISFRLLQITKHTLQSLRNLNHWRKFFVFRTRLSKSDKMSPFASVRKSLIFIRFETRVIMYYSFLCNDLRWWNIIEVLNSEYAYSSSPTLPRGWFFVRITFVHVSKCFLVAKEVIVLPLRGWYDIQYQQTDRRIRKSLALLSLNFWLPMIETHCLASVISVFFIWPCGSSSLSYSVFPLLLLSSSNCTIFFL